MVRRVEAEKTVGNSKGTSELSPESTSSQPARCGFLTVKAAIGESNTGQT
jgi:hypothetical protein